MQIKTKINRKRLERIIAYSEYLEFFCKNAPLIDDFQKASSEIRKFLYELDVDDIIEKPQWEFNKKAIMDDIKEKYRV